MLDRTRKTIIAMLHLGALPGTPRCHAPLSQVISDTVAEARLLAAAGVDALLIENMHDVPYLNGEVGPEIVAGMTAAACAVRSVVELPLGVQVLAGANRAAMAVALAAGAEFIRAENFAYAHVADEGLMPTADAGPLLRFRRQIGAAGIAIFADIKKKHASHAITADVSLDEAVRTAAFCGADGVIITGVATGSPARPEEVAIARAATDRPVLVGSGVTAETLPALWPHADAFIVGSTLKRDGKWDAPLDAERVRKFVSAVHGLRALTAGFAE